MAKLFTSYSHRDERALERLHTHLAMLKREGLIAAWHDRAILAGDNIDNQIDSHLAEGDIFLALVSPDFLDSKYCYEREMTTALKRHDEGTLRVIPIIQEPCDWTSSPLGQLRALPKDGKAISTWTNENVAYVDIVKELRRALAGPTPPHAAKSSPSQPQQATETAPRKYRVRRDFDSIDQDNFRLQSFEIIRDYFSRSCDELDQLDGIRARFEDMSSAAFSCTVINKAAREREAHITVHANGSGMFGGGMYYSFSRQAAPNTANGFIRIEAGDYELQLKLDAFSQIGRRGDEPKTPKQVAESLWCTFIARAGIDHD